MNEKLQGASMLETRFDALEAEFEQTFKDLEQEISEVRGVWLLTARALSCPACAPLTGVRVTVLKLRPGRS